MEREDGQEKKQEELQLLHEDNPEWAGDEPGAARPEESQSDEEKTPGDAGPETK